MLTHLTTTPIGAQRLPITSVPNDFTRTSFPNIVSTRLPLQRNPLALNAGNETPTPTRSYVLLTPRQPLWLTRPCKYYHKHSTIESKNRHETTV